MFLLQSNKKKTILNEHIFKNILLQYKNIKCLKKTYLKFQLKPIKSLRVVFTLFLHKRCK